MKLKYFIPILFTFGAFLMPLNLFAENPGGNDPEPLRWSQFVDDDCVGNSGGCLIIVVRG